MRLALAVFVGGLIGYEREYNNRPAGLRTHILVCIGASVVSLIQMYSINDVSTLIMQHPKLADGLKADVGRMGAQVVSGVGFLGAGTIIHEKGSIKGLTTAASLWVVACIGLGVGMGYYFLSITASISVFLLLVILKKIELKFFHEVNLVKLEVEYNSKNNMMEQIEKYFNQQNISVKDIEFMSKGNNREKFISIYNVLAPRYKPADKIIQDVCRLEDVVRASIL